MPIETGTLETFEPGNPFLQDATSCGADLRSMTCNERLKGVYVMSNSFNHHHGGYDFYIVDSANGQRIGVKLDYVDQPQQQQQQQQPHQYDYDLAVPDYGAVMTVQQFRDAVQCGGFIDYDGFGYPAKSVDGVLKTAYCHIYPSHTHDTDGSNIPHDATHIVWFNK